MLIILKCRSRFDDLIINGKAYDTDDKDFIKIETTCETFFIDKKDIISMVIKKKERYTV